MRIASLLLVVACSGEKKPAKKTFEDAAVPVDAARVRDERRAAASDRLAGAIERVAAALEPCR